MSVRIEVGALANAVERFAEQVVVEAAQEVRDRIDLRVPVRDGTLKESGYTTEPEQSGRGFSATIGFTAEHAIYTDEGTSAHEIPGNPLLVFFWPVTGRVMYLRSVWWTPDGPGSTGAVERNKGWFSETVEEWGEQAMVYAAANTVEVEA